MIGCPISQGNIGKDHLAILDFVQSSGQVVPEFAQGLEKGHFIDGTGQLCASCRRAGHHPQPSSAIVEGLRLPAKHELLLAAVHLVDGFAVEDGHFGLELAELLPQHLTTKLKL